MCHIVHSDTVIYSTNPWQKSYTYINRFRFFANLKSMAEAFPGRLSDLVVTFPASSQRMITHDVWILLNHLQRWLVNCNPYINHI
jgi:hypothetical protein